MNLNLAKPVEARNIRPFGYTVFLLAITTVFALQMIRVLLNGLVFYLRESQGMDTISVGLYAFLTFLTAFSATVFHRILGDRASLTFTAGGLAILRLAEQFVTSPLLDLALSTVGTVLFLLFIPIFTGRLRAIGTSTGQTLAIGILLGIAIDTATKGIFGTLDLSWHQNWIVHSVMIILVSIQGALIWTFCKKERIETRGSSIRDALPLLGIGPLIFLSLMWFQNIGQQTTILGWSQPWVFLWIGIGNSLSIILVLLINSLSRRPPIWLILLPAILLPFSLLIEWSGGLGAFTLFFGQLALAALFAVSAITLFSGPPKSGLSGDTIIGSVGMLAFMMLMFGYYAQYDIDIPVTTNIIYIIPSILLSTVGLLSYRKLPLGKTQAAVPWGVCVAVVLLLLLPVGYLIRSDDPQSVVGEGFPVRVMSYNVHQGFNTEGLLDMEELTRIIQRQQPDIVALQEISRGWVIDGAFDMLTWLSQELDMPFVWGPSADSVWGNAILSRYPISWSDNIAMPNNDMLLLKRSMTIANIDIGAGESLWILATHLHHIENEPQIRNVQVKAILEQWDERQSAVILGDLNATPGDGEINLLRESGLLDAFKESGNTQKGYTYPSYAPIERIDYIWISPDLSARNFVVGQSQGSDHMPVSATISR